MATLAFNTVDPNVLPENIPLLLIPKIRQPIQNQSILGIHKINQEKSN